MRWYFGRLNLANVPFWCLVKVRRVCSLRVDVPVRRKDALTPGPFECDPHSADAAEQIYKPWPDETCLTLCAATASNRVLEALHTTNLQSLHSGIRSRHVFCQLRAMALDQSRFQDK